MQEAYYTRQTRLLLDILECMEFQTPDIQPFFALKGGTALNLFVLPFPRLSVDIDLTYCPLDDRDTAFSAMKKGLQRVEQALNSRLSGVQCVHKQSSGGDKLFVSHDGVTVRIEPNGVIRGTVFPTEVRPLCEEAQIFFKKIVSARCLSRADLYGGKICAAMDRQHPRDLFDILPLMQAGSLEENVRKAFLVYAISHPRPLSELLDPRPQPLEQVFKEEFYGITREPVAIEKLEEAREWLIEAVRSGLTMDERHFLLSCKAGEPDWSLAGLPSHVPQLPAVRWKLHNIAALQKQPEKHATSLAKLESCLFSSHLKIHSSPEPQVQHVIRAGLDPRELEKSMPGEDADKLREDLRLAAGNPEAWGVCEDAWKAWGEKHAVGRTRTFPTPEGPKTEIVYDDF